MGGRSSVFKTKQALLLMILDDYNSYKVRHLYDSSRERVKFVTDVCDYGIQTGEVGVEIKIQIPEVSNLKSII